MSNFRIIKRTSHEGVVYIIESQLYISGGPYWMQIVFEKFKSLEDAQLAIDKLKRGFEYTDEVVG